MQVPLNNVTYSFYRVTEGGTLTAYRLGAASQLGYKGCGYLRLESQTRYWLEVSDYVHVYIYIYVYVCVKLNIGAW
jgi:hypothetical protein